MSTPAGQSLSITAGNRITLVAIKGPEAAVSFTNLTFVVVTSDSTATNFYSVGVYGPCAPGTASCSLVCQTPASQALTTTGGKDLACGSGTNTLNPASSGQYYYLATTGMATTATMYSSDIGIQPVCSNNAATSTGGALPSTITIPAASWGLCNSPNGPVVTLHD